MTTVGCILNVEAEQYVGVLDLQGALRAELGLECILARAAISLSNRGFFAMFQNQELLETS